METSAIKILNFIKDTNAFTMMPETYLKITKNKLISGSKNHINLY